MAAMRSMWNGAISFGLVSVPIRLFKATESHDISFNQLHAADGGKISYKKVCGDCGEEVGTADICKGHKIGDDYVVVTEEEIRDLQGEQPKVVEVLQFVDPAEVHPLSFEASYYAVPSGPVNGYALLLEAMRSTDKVAICRVTLRTKTSLAALRILDDRVLAMSTLAWPDEIRQPEFSELDKPVTLKPQEVAVAKMLVESMSGAFKPEEFADTYHQRLSELILAKSTGEKFTPAQQVDNATENVDDLLAMLEASIAAKKAAQEPHTPPVKAPRKRKVA